MKLYSYTLVWCLFLFGFFTKKFNNSTNNNLACTLTVDAGPDMTICTPGQVPLNGTVLGDFIGAEWTPAIGVLNPNSPVTTANVTQTTTYTLTASSLDGTNLITNANFDGGLTGFTSDYIPGTGGTFGLLSGEGQFAVATNAADTHNNFAPCTDHTGGGSMLVVNGAGVVNQNVWCQQVAVVPGTEYAFSAWITSVVSGSPAQLQFSVNGTLLGGIFNASPVTCAWNQFFATWNSGGNTNVEICIVNQNTATGGNDFAIDDISFGELCEATDQVTITVIELDATFTPPASVCQLSGIIDLNSTLSPFATLGGNWTVNSINTQFFDPLTLGPGLHTVTYTVTNGPCVESMPATIFVEPLPDPSWAAPAAVCLGSQPIFLNDLLLPGAEPGGFWTVNGSFTNTFDPLILGVGLHQVSYTVGTLPCQSMLEQFILVSPLPDASWTAPNNICVGNTTFELDDWLNPGAEPGGIWTVDGSQTTTFDPMSLGAGIHSVVYSVGTFPCVNQLPQFVEIVATPNANWNVPTGLCLTAPLLNLNDLLVPGTQQGGIWLVNGTITNNFDPGTVGPGIHTVSYTVGTAPCQSTIEQTIEIQALPNSDWTAPGDLCTTDAIINLNDLLNANAQTGGNWTINGTNNTQFNPALLGPGIYSVVYTVGPISCQSTQQQTIEVVNLPNANWAAPADLCTTDGSITLNDLLDANAQTGGTWTVNGTLSTQFNPTTLGAGGYTVVYSVGTAPCANQVSQTINILAPGQAPQPICGNSTLNTLEFTWPAVPNATSYAVNVITGQPGNLAGTTFSLTGLGQGEEVQIQVTANFTGPCGPITSAVISCSTTACASADVSIDPVDAFCFDSNLNPFDLSYTLNSGDPSGVVTWSGTGITDATNGTFDPLIAGIGQHIITLTYDVNNCVSTSNFTLEILGIPESDFTLTTPHCLDQSSIITYTGAAEASATYLWNFDGGTINSGSGQGPYTVSWDVAGDYTISLEVTENGCVSSTTTEVVQIEPLLIPPVINCMSTDNSVTFTWDEVDNANNYTVNVLGGLTGTFIDNTSYQITGLSAGDQVSIELTVESANNCPDLLVEHTCVAEECPDITLEIDPIDAICLLDNTTIDLEVVISGASANGTGTWDGPGITNQNTGIFDPAIAGPGLHQITFEYEESANCIYNTGITIDVPTIPIATFTAPDSICFSESATITFTGQATNDAIYIWNFDGAIINSGIGVGPYNLSWADAGLKTIQLSIEQGACTTEIFSQTIQVDPLLEVPVINCEASFDGLLFTWLPLAAADGYQVNVLAGNPGTLLADTAYFIDNILPGETVNIEVIALSNTQCPATSATLNCTSPICPAVSLEITPQAPVCLNGSPQFTLDYAISGDSPSGQLAWEGPGIIDSDNGIWQPNAAMIGQNNLIILNYMDGPCMTSDSIEIEVFQQPAAAFTLDPLICQDEFASINFTGLASSTANYNWDFGTAVANPGIGPGPHQLSWDQAGNYSISLEIEDNGCTASFEQLIQVDKLLDAPEISCIPRVNSIEFSWNPIANATGYEITVLDGPMGIMNNPTSYYVEGLSPSQSVTIEVTALSDNACPNTSTIFTCSSLECPLVELIIAPVDPICFELGLAPMTLAYMISGSDNTGTFTWSGPGIIDAANGVLQVHAGMIGQTNLIYLNYEQGNCSYIDSLNIEVFPIPQASFSFEPTICLGESIIVEYTGSASFDAIYDWNFEAANPPIATGPGPHIVDWTTPGQYNINLSVKENGCAATPLTEIVQVDAPLEAPVINCDATFNSIFIDWEEVANAQNYSIDLPDGQDGMFLDNTSFEITNLADGFTIDAALEIQSINACPPISVPINCATTICPEAILTIIAPEAICEGETILIKFNFEGSEGPFDVELLVNNTPFAFTGISNSHTESFDLDVSTTFSITSLNNQAAPVCEMALPSDFTIQVNNEVDAGIAASDLSLCSGQDTFLLLSDLLFNEDPNGSWTEISTIPSSGTAFNAASGIFDPSEQASGLYQFLYRVAANAPCLDDSEIVTVRIDETPIADAGEDMTIDCFSDILSLGGQSSEGNTIRYTWTAVNGTAIDINNQAIIEVLDADQYVLTVENIETGCTASDAVTVQVDTSLLNPNVSVTPISCFQANDGLINVDNVEGGSAPYSYALNGGNFGNQSYFSNLNPGIYVLTIRDSKGCETQLEFDFEQPDQIEVRLITNLEGDDQTIQSGDSLLLSALVNVPEDAIDQIFWYPDSIDCPGCFQQTLAPQITTAYSVTVIDENGCTDSDNTTVLVEKNRDIYIPNAFSPNNDGINDVIMVFGGQNVVEVHSFLIFNRWGELVFENGNFQPNDPAHGWDGTHRGEIMNPAVFVYQAQVEMKDGEIILLKGSVNLVK